MGTEREELSGGASSGSYVADAGNSATGYVVLGMTTSSPAACHPLLVSAARVRHSAVRRFSSSAMN